MLTDHKNQEYIRSAKRLNPRQAGMSLFFFFVLVLDHISAKTGKTDTLSHIHKIHTEEPDVTASIMPSSRIPDPSAFGHHD